MDLSFTCKVFYCSLIYWYKLFYSHRQSCINHILHLVQFVCPGLPIWYRCAEQLDITTVPPTAPDIARWAALEAFHWFAGSLPSCLLLSAEQKSAITVIQKCHGFYIQPKCAHANEPTWCKMCCKRCACVDQTSAYAAAQQQSLAQQLLINEGKILATAAKFTTKYGMQEAAAIWEVSNHIKASIWWDGIVCLWSLVLHFHRYAFRFIQHKRHKLHKLRLQYLGKTYISFFLLLILILYIDSTL